MTQEEIIKEKTRLFQIIEGAQSDLKKLRSECGHPNTFDGIWSEGSRTYDATICSDCGECIKVRGFHVISSHRMEDIFGK